MIDPITDSDLIAFVDGQLDPMRRLEVEAHLAAHPEAAARVMADFHDRDALRASFRERMGPGPTATSPWRGASTARSAGAASPRG